ncbi:hypothetical protein V6D40_08660 [Corynebacterium sp. Q4381]|uniref:hypothetical protein n=1 Tax=Corynebacterium sp. Marseille-Q4381 TaxID=3121597 RepID=UPI002FE6837B
MYRSISFRKAVVAPAFTLALTAAAVAPAMVATASTAASTVETRENDTAVFSTANNGRDLLISLKHGATFAEQGKDVVVKDATGNVVETLPEAAVNKERDTIGFYYTVKNGNQLQVTQTGANGAVTYGWWSDWGKCAVGTGGSALVAGAVSGGWGALGGGMVGAATFC